MASSLRVFQFIVCGFIAVACAGNAAPQSSRSQVPFTFDGNRAKELVIPVTMLGAGTIVPREYAITAEELVATARVPDRADLNENLNKNGYTAGYVRAFQLENGGVVPDARQVTVLLFRDSAAAKDVAASLTAIRQRNGWYEFSMPGRIGDESRLSGVNIQGPEGETEIWEVAYVYINALVLCVTSDDAESGASQNAADLALVEQRFLREAVARQTPKPS
jgi:hypothetical protein